MNAPRRGRPLSSLSTPLRNAAGASRTVASPPCARSICPRAHSLPAASRAKTVQGTAASDAPPRYVYWKAPCRVGIGRAGITAAPSCTRPEALVRSRPKSYRQAMRAPSATRPSGSRTCPRRHGRGVNATCSGANERPEATSHGGGLARAYPVAVTLRKCRPAGRPKAKPPSGPVAVGPTRRSPSSRQTSTVAPPTARPVSASTAVPLTRPAGVKSKSASARSPAPTVRRCAELRPCQEQYTCTSPAATPSKR